MEIINLIASSNFVTVNKELMKILGMEEAVVFCELASELKYWRVRGEALDGWFFSTVENIERQTTLNDYKQRKVFNRLQEYGLIETENRGLPCKRYVRINEEQVIKILSTKNSNDLRTSSLNFKELSSENFKELDVENLKGNNNKVNNNKKNNNNNNTSVKTNEPISDFPILDNPTLENPILDNQGLINTNNNKYQNKINTNKNNSSDKAEELEEGVPVNDLILKGGELWKPTKAEYDVYCETYTEAVVVEEFKKMNAWLTANADKRKTKRGMGRFVNGWLNRSKNQPQAQKPSWIKETVLPKYLDELETNQQETMSNEEEEALRRELLELQKSL